MKPCQAVAFLDRDGVLIEDVHYLSRPDQLRFRPGVPRALRELQRLGFRLAVVTNQSGVARGYLSLAQLHRVHRLLALRLQQEGVYGLEFLVCPHHPSERCGCRKPGTFLALQYFRRHPEVCRGIVVGDRASDMAFAQRLGFPGFCVGTCGLYNAPEIVGSFPGLPEVVQWLKQHPGFPS